MSWLKEEASTEVSFEAKCKKKILTVQRNIFTNAQNQHTQTQTHSNDSKTWISALSEVVVVFLNVAAVGKFEPWGFMFQEINYSKSRGVFFLTGSLQHWPKWASNFH